MRKNINNIVKIFSEEFTIQEPVIELGSFQVPGQDKISDLRPYFKNKIYIGCDMREGPGVDKIENIEQLSFEDSSVGTVILMDTLEHVKNCHKALDEVYRVLKKDGIVIMSSVMDFPIHDHPYDYWRFTPEAFKLLLDKFKIKIIGFEGNLDKPHTVFAIGVKYSPRNLIIKEQFKRFRKRYLETNIELKKNSYYRRFLNGLKNKRDNILKKREQIEIQYYSEKK